MCISVLYLFISLLSTGSIGWTRKVKLSSMYLLYLISDRKYTFRSYNRVHPECVAADLKQP